MLIFFPFYFINSFPPSWGRGWRSRPRWGRWASCYWTLNDFGYPIFPVAGHWALNKKKGVIRHYAQLNYRELSFNLLVLRFIDFRVIYAGTFTCNRSARVPWAAIRADPSHFLEEGCLPKGVELLEPSRLKVEEVESLWAHWLGRQEVGRWQRSHFPGGLGEKTKRLPEDMFEGRKRSRQRAGKGKGKGNRKGERREICRDWWGVTGWGRRWGDRWRDGWGDGWGGGEGGAWPPDC